MPLLLFILILLTNPKRRKDHRVYEREIKMNDKEKFADFAEKLVQDNENMYGAEIRSKYGDEAVENSNAKVKGMTVDQYKEIEKLSEELNAALKQAFEQGNPTSELAMKACKLHKDWLCYFWDDYSNEAHIGIAEMYVSDPRFTAYYDNIAPGSAMFLRDALVEYCKL